MHGPGGFSRHCSAGGWRSADCRPRRARRAPRPGRWRQTTTRACGGTPTESGWGINFAHQGDIIFATWFTYDAAGKPWWLIAELHKSARRLHRRVATVSGPPFDAQPWDLSRVAEATVGTMTATFAGAKQATIAYTVNGVAQTKAITKQVFGPEPTCVFGRAAEPRARDQLPGPVVEPGRGIGLGDQPHAPGRHHLRDLVHLRRRRQAVVADRRAAPHARGHLRGRRVDGDGTGVQLGSLRLDQGHGDRRRHGHGDLRRRQHGAVHLHRQRREPGQVDHAAGVRAARDRMRAGGGSRRRRSTSRAAARRCCWCPARDADVYVTIAPRNGYAGAVALTASGLPAGVTGRDRARQLDLASAPVGRAAPQRAPAGQRRRRAPLVTARGAADGGLSAARELDLGVAPAGDPSAVRLATWQPSAAHARAGPAESRRRSVVQGIAAFMAARPGYRPPVWTSRRHGLGPLHRRQYTSSPTTAIPRPARGREPGRCSAPQGPGGGGSEATKARCSQSFGASLRGADADRPDARLPPGQGLDGAQGSGGRATSGR